MTPRSAAVKILAIVVSLLTLIATAPFSIAETRSASPLGTIVTTGTVTVGNSAAPTGTTVFAGDRVTTTSQPALINLSSGSRLEMTKAVATLSREGKTLIVETNQGLLRFNFLKGEDVQIDAGRYRFNALGTNSAHIGELGLNQNGQLVLAVSEGVFASYDMASGESGEVSPNNPLQATGELDGKGTLTQGGHVFTVITKPYDTANKLKGKCIVASDDTHHEEHPINANTQTVITIKGDWKLKTDTYGYKITCCDSDVSPINGKGTLTQGAHVFTVITKPYDTANKLKGKCIVASDDTHHEAHPINANTQTVITIKGDWKLKTDTYDYKITCCDDELLAAAAAGAGAAAGLSAAAIAGIVGGGAAVGLGVGIYEAEQPSGSPSSR